MRILIVEDEASLAKQLASSIAEAGYAVDHAADGERADFLAQTKQYDAMLLDLGLPKIDGLTLLRKWRDAGLVTPVIVLTARGSWHEKVRGIDGGADDYVSKPFRIEEVLARLRALLRRSELARPPALAVLDLQLDPASHRVTRGGAIIELTTKEYQILEVLMRKSGQVVTRTGLEEQVWGGVADLTTNTVDVHISHLRRKIDHGHAIAILHTVRGHGYILGPASAR